MLIDCPACARSYHVTRDEIGARGRTVICPRCEAQWLVDGEGRALAEELNASAISVRIEPRIRPDQPRTPRLRALRPWIAAVAGIAGLMMLIGARDSVVRIVPRMARLYAVAGLPVNVRGLEFVRVASARLDASVPTMTLSGEIRNVASHRVRVPRVAYEVRDAAGAPLLTWSEAGPTQILGAGKTIVFASQPHDIPAAAQNVVVHFQSDDAEKPARMASADR